MRTLHDRIREMNTQTRSPTVRSAKSSGRHAALVPPSTGTIVGTTIAALAVSAVINHLLARKAERDNPPAGRFVHVDGVRVHYIDRGEGEPLVLLHGNGSMIQDFQASGLIDTAAQRYRVIAIDRPGYGHSSRPRTTVWTPEAQAILIHSVLTRLGVKRATILGHSWGCSVAVALAHKYPGFVRSLVLVSGYYYPSVRPDVVAMSGPALPLVGDVIRYSISPILSRLAWPFLMRKLFDPQPIPKKFARFPKALAVRPSQIRASAAEAALMIPDAFKSRDSYSDLRMPVAIVVGSDDRLIDPDAQSARLHRDIPHSTFDRVPETGHMAHQTATAVVMAAIDKSAQTLGPSRVIHAA